MKKSHTILNFMLALLFTVAAPLVSAEPQRTAHSMVDLIAEQASVPVGGGTVTVGLFLQPDESWHAYWINPGDAGKQVSVKWSLPDGFEASEFDFPAPHAIPFMHLVTYGYDEPILLLSEITVPAGLAEGDTVKLEGKASWVVCDDELCVPERAWVSVELPVGEGRTHPLMAGRFSEARSKVPEIVDWPAQFELVDGEVSIAVQTPEDFAGAADPYLFIEEKRIVKYENQTVAFAPRGLSVTMEAGRKADTFSEFNAVLGYHDASGATHAVEVAVSRATAPLAALTAADSGKSPSAGGTSRGGLNWGVALLFAFLGGIILNLMPCVFPILSMKALSLVQMSHSDLKEARASGWMYTFGILVAFAITGAILVAMREAGQAVGWGFQMQSPMVVLGLGLLMLAVSLNLFGVFEIGTSLMSKGQGLTEGKGERTAAFFTGLLAVVVATPCMAPFMAGALGYALAQPTAIAMSIFLVMGLGLAFPYLVLSYMPGMSRWMPNPGPWMDTFKQILAFPMLLAAVYLFWVLGGQLGPDSLVMGLVAAVCLGFALWAFGKRANSRLSPVWSVLAIVGLVTMGVSAYKAPDFKQLPGAPADGHAGTLGGLELEHFTPERVMGYIEEGQPVFVYFTADWCVSCKVNERVALASDAVAEGFSSRNIKVVEGDWTSEDPVITEWLEMYDRIGVPLYLYFPNGSDLESVSILPQILTPDIVLDAIDQADAGVIIRSDGGAEAQEVAMGTPESGNEDADSGPAAADWTVVQAYIDVDTIWHEKDNKIRDEVDNREDYIARRDAEMEEHPDITAAVAAANAILDLQGKQEKTHDAARFLIDQTRGTEDMATHMERGAVVMARFFRDDETWPMLLMNLDFYTEPGDSQKIEAVFSTMAKRGSTAQVRSTAKYYQASRLLRLSNAVATPNEERESYRLEAVEIATGLSTGAENEDLIRRQRYTDDGEPIPFAKLGKAEEDLLYNLTYMTVGQDLPDVRAPRLDGVEEDFSAFSGQVVLLDFWATWCGPCKAALPKLNELAGEFPASDFEILSISVDEEVETVTDFQQDTPMPWSNWHIGPKSEILKTWAVRGYPTYILVDSEGKIAARTHDMDEQFIELIKTTVCNGGDNNDTLSC